MGLFLDLSGIAGASGTVVEQTLERYVIRHAGVFDPMPATADDLNVVAIAEAPHGKVSILHRGSFLKWFDVSVYLSHSLKAPVFHFQIHDEDIWIYQLFVKGIEVDAFNPVPDYWGNITAAEQRRWAGSPRVICQHWPGVTEVDLRNYLRRWDESGEQKAYPDDTHSANDIWQMSDFMRRLGLICPVDEEGNVVGRTYRFEIPIRPG